MYVMLTFTASVHWQPLVLKYAFPADYMLHAVIDMTYDHKLLTTVPSHVVHTVLVLITPIQRKCH